GKRQSHLRVMNTGRGHDGTDGDLAVHDTQMELVALPSLDKSLAVALAAYIARSRQFGQHLIQATFLPPGAQDVWAVKGGAVHLYAVGRAGSVSRQRPPSLGA